jgi:hypothetical protein
MHGERVARFGALDEERSRLRVAAFGDPLAVAVAACRVDAPGCDRVAVCDAKHRLVLPDRDMEVRRFENVTCHCGYTSATAPSRGVLAERAGTRNGP